MKAGFRFVFIAVTATLFTGCLFKPVTVSTRNFVLAPVSTNALAPVGTEHLSVGIGLVKMPPYLLRNSMAVRNGANEIEYLDDARWGERLDQCFQQTLAVNLSRLLPSDSIFLTDWARDQVLVRVSVNVQQFEVDTSGTGTLVAQWRITAPDSDAPLKSGDARLIKAGASPRGKPEIIATTLSDLTADFSRELAQAIRESAEKHARAD
jgi:uncharacterized lipoprotein YmbA